LAPTLLSYTETQINKVSIDTGHIDITLDKLNKRQLFLTLFWLKNKIVATSSFCYQFNL